MRRSRPTISRAPAVGSHRTGDVFSFSLQPLQATLTVVSASERVTVPAGAFDACLLTELVTAHPDDQEDHAPEGQHQLNRTILCGRRRAWYAPGVGLVQLLVETGDGTEALIQLQKYTVPTAGGEYLPLAVDNAWTYGWASIPPDYFARESYRVTGNSGDRWHLAHAAFAYKKTPRRL